MQVTSFFFFFFFFFFLTILEAKDIQLSLGKRAATVLGNGCQLCLPSVRF